MRVTEVPDDATEVPDAAAEKAWDMRAPIADAGAPPLSVYDPFDHLYVGAMAMVPSLEVRSGRWGTAFRYLSNRKLQNQQWLAECLDNGYETLKISVDIDPEIRGGVPVLRGTGFTVAQALAELAEATGVPQLADEFDLDPKVVKAMLIGLSLIFQRPCGR